MTDDLHPTDWRVATARFAELFPDTVNVSVLRNRLYFTYGPTQNIATPDVLGYVADPDGTPVEVTTGIGITGDRIYGLTWPKPSPDGPRDPRNRMAHRLEDVAAILDGTYVESDDTTD